MAPGEPGDPRPPRVLVAAAGALSVVDLHHYVARLQLEGWEVRLALSRGAARLVSVAALRAMTGGHPVVDETGGGLAVPHMELADWADQVLVLPASANVLAKCALGIADDLLTTAVLAAEPPVLFVPSMNPAMWKRPSVQRNVARLREDGHVVVLRDHPGKAFEASSGSLVPSELMPAPEDVARLVRLRAARS